MDWSTSPPRNRSSHQRTENAAWHERTSRLKCLSWMDTQQIRIMDRDIQSIIPSRMRRMDSQGGQVLRFVHPMISFLHVSTALRNFHFRLLLTDKSIKKRPCKCPLQMSVNASYATGAIISTLIGKGLYGLRFWLSAKNPIRPSVLAKRQKSIACPAVVGGFSQC